MSCEELNLFKKTCSPRLTWNWESLCLSLLSIGVAGVGYRAQSSLIRGLERVGQTVLGAPPAQPTLNFDLVLSLE